MNRGNDPRARREALEMFGDLLHSGDTTEHQWQCLFTKNPFILTDSLPVRLSAVYPHIELDSGEPDFAFFEPSGHLGYYGVIELKRPTDKILRVYSTKHIVPSAKLAQARAQVEQYLESLSRSPVLWSQSAIALAHARYAFIIIGRTPELLAKCTDTLQQLQFRNLLPPGIQVVPYDELFERFARSRPQAVIMDFLTADYNNPGGVLEPQRFQGFFDEYDIYDHAVFKIITTHGWPRMLSGRYRQVFGVPRKLWPIGNNRLTDFYFYEIREKLGNEKFDELLAELSEASMPLHAYEIDGVFDTETARWGEGALMSVKTGDDRIVETQVDGWDFSLYEGDRIYFEDGRPFLYTAFPGESK